MPRKAGIIVHVFNTCTQKAETERSLWVQGQTCQPGETVSQKQNIVRKNKSKGIIWDEDENRYEIQTFIDFDKQTVKIKKYD